MGVSIRAQGFYNQGCILVLKGLWVLKVGSRFDWGILWQHC